MVAGSSPRRRYSQRCRQCLPGDFATMLASDFRLQLRDELEAQDLLGDPRSREACAEQACIAGERALTQLQELAGVRTVRDALSVRRGPEYAQTYRYVIGFGQLMTEFLIAPVSLDEAGRDRV